MKPRLLRSPTTASSSNSSKENTMTHVITINGFDYVKTSLLNFYINQGFVLAIA